MMDRWLLQMLTILGIACLGAAATFMIMGAPDRGVPCDPSQIDAGEVCLDTVINDWGGKTVWIDARPRKEFEEWHQEGAYLINGDPNEDFEEMLATVAESLTLAEKVVVYCGKKGCGASKEIAERLRSYEFGPDIYTLYGGVRAFQYQRDALSN